MSLLSIVQRACNRLSLNAPAAVIGSTDLTAAQLLALLRTEIDETRKRHEWAALVATATPTVTAGMIQNSIAAVPQPGDFQRLMSDTTLYHVQRRRALLGPVSSREWQQLTIGSVPTSAGYWRRVGRSFQIAGVAAGEGLSYDYVSQNVVIAQDGTPKSDFTADTDALATPEYLAELGLVWRFRHAKGLDYGEDMKTYEVEFERAAADDRGPVRPIATSDRAARDAALPFVITPT